MTKRPILTKVNCDYGAPMGRHERHSPDPNVPFQFYLHRIYLNDGYDDGGAYWGSGQPLYRAYAETDDYIVDFYLRAPSRENAKHQVLILYPEAFFKRK